MRFGEQVLLEELCLFEGWGTEGCSMRGQIQRSDRTRFVATDVLSERKCASLCADLEVDVELQRVQRNSLEAGIM